MHCLPALHDDHTAIGRAVMQRIGMSDGFEVTDDVVQSAASVVIDETENRLHTSKAILVAAIASDRL